MTTRTPPPGTTPPGADGDHRAGNPPATSAPPASPGPSRRSKAAIADSLGDSAEALASSAREIARQLRDDLGASEPLDESALAGLGIDAITHLVLEEVEREARLNDRIDRLQQAVSLLDSAVIRGARNQYQCSTGLLDDHPRASAAICGGLSVLSLGAGIYLAWATHGAVHHAVDAAVHAVAGPGWLAAVLVVPAVLFALFLEGIPVLASAAVGPMMFGVIKTLGGRMARRVSPRAARRFAWERDCAARLSERLRASTRSLGESLDGVKRLIPDFFRRNEILRKAGSLKLLESKADDTPDTATAHELGNLNSILGVGEFGAIVRFTNLQKRLNRLKPAEFRSPELRADPAGGGAAHRKGLRYLLHSGFVHAVGVIRGVAGSSHVVGTQTAISAADDLNTGCSHLPDHLLLDPLSGTGAAIGSTLHLGIETFDRPEKALLDAIKSFAGVASTLVSGAAPEGPSALTLLRVILVADKLKGGRDVPRSNVIRWATEVLFTLALVIFKKPALAFKAQKLEEETGKLSPHGIEAELADDEGRLSSAWKSVREIVRLSSAIIAGVVYNLLVDVPLRTLACLDPNRPIIGGVSRISRAVLEWFTKRHDRRLEARVARSLERHPAPETLRNLDGADLELHALILSVDYRYNDESTVSQDEMNATLSYWMARRDLEWKQRIGRRNRHLEELRSFPPRAAGTWRDALNRATLLPPLVRLHYHLHPEDSGMASARSVLTEVAGNLRSRGAPKPPPPPLELMPTFLEIAAELRRSVERPGLVPTIVDVGAGRGEIVMVTAEGDLQVLRGSDGCRTLLGCRGDASDPKRRGIRILPHADEARIATVEILLSTPLEPFQRTALLAAHRDLVAGRTTPDDAAALLFRHHFTAHQLFGTRDASGHPLKPGLFDLGVIGS